MPQTSRSLRRRPARICRLFWCHQCLRTVRIIASPDFNVFCPRCYGRFLHELDFPRPRLLADFMDLNADPTHFPNFLDSLAAALGLSDSWILFRSLPPHAAGDLVDHRPEPSLGGHHVDQAQIAPAPPAAPVRPDGNAIPPNVQPGDYFMGAGLNELIQGLTENDRPGPPPAPPSAIDAMPTVTIEQAHLVDGSQCPVCKEDFGVGDEAREMPCKHVYHSDCIVPWLRAHNSCPVCRYALPSDSHGGIRPRDEDEETYGADGGGRPRRGRWNPFTLSWPFWSPRANDRHRQEMDDGARDGDGGKASSALVTPWITGEKPPASYHACIDGVAIPLHFTADRWASEFLSLVPVLCMCAALTAWLRSWLLL